MEDLDFVRRLERFGQTHCIRVPHLITSSRRFEQRHPLQMLQVWIWLHVLFWVGASPDRLAEFYSTRAPRSKIAAKRARPEYLCDVGEAR